MLTLAWLAGALALAHAVAAVSTPIYLDSYTPQLEYKPDSTNNTGQGPSWNASFTGISWAEREDRRGGKIGVGQGYHWVRGASDTGASVSFTFYGTGVEFFGHWGYLDRGDVHNGTGGEGFGAVTLRLTGTPDSLQDVTSSGTMMGVSRPVSLGRYADLSRGTYTVTMRPTAGIVSFTHLVVQMDVGGSLTDVTQAVANPSIYYPYIVNPDSSLALNPTFGTFHGPPGSSELNSTGSWAGQSSDDNKRIGTRVFQESVHVNLGVGHNFLSINGSVNTNHGVFRAAIAPAPPGRQGSRDFWGATSWQVLDTVLIAVGLDQDTEYSVNLTNIQGLNGEAHDYNMWFDITSLTLWKAPTEAKATAGHIIGEQPSTVQEDTGDAGDAEDAERGKSSPPVGAIVGGVVTSTYFEPVSYTTTPYVDSTPQPPSSASAFSEPSRMSIIQPYAGPTSPTVASSRHFSGSESSTGQPVSYDAPRAGSLAGLAGLGFMPPGAPHTQPRASFLATDAGPYRGTTPGGEMPPTYNPMWDASPSDSAADYDSADRMMRGGDSKRR